MTVNWEAPAPEGPLFVTLKTTDSAVADEDTTTGLGPALKIEIARSVPVATFAVAVAVLLAERGSPAEFATVALSVSTVPLAVVAGTRTVTWIVAAEPTENPVVVQVTGPVPLQFHPAGAVKDWNVVDAGSVSVKVTVPDVFGPLFTIVCEYVT